MARLEELSPGAIVEGVRTDGPVTVVSAQWFGQSAVELTYKVESTGSVGNQLLYRTDEEHLRIVEGRRRWAFDGKGDLIRCVAEAKRMRLAYLFDPRLAVHVSQVEALSHQISAIYEEMLPRQSLRFLLADNPGAGKTIMAGVRSKDYFGYATGLGEEGKYTGLAFGSPSPGVYFDDTSVVVRPVVAEEYVKEQQQGKPTEEKPATAGAGTTSTAEQGDGDTASTEGERVKHPKHFFATVRLNPLRMSSDAETIGQEVIQHLEALLVSNVDITLEITAQSGQGFPDNVVRIVTENARTLKFENFGFEEE